MKRFSILTTGTKGTPRYFMVDHKNTSELFWDFVAKRKKRSSSPFVKSLVKLY